MSRRPDAGAVTGAPLKQQARLEPRTGTTVVVDDDETGTIADVGARDIRADVENLRTAREQKKVAMLRALLRGMNSALPLRHFVFLPRE